MKRKIITLFIILMVSSLFAEKWNIYAGADQATLDTIKKCDEQIAQRQYASAANTVGVCSNEYIIYKYIEVCTQYFAQSMMHSLFAFKNLEEGETLYDVRTGEGSYSITYRDEPDTIIDNYKKEHGNSMVLELARANYYYDALSRYGEQWLKTPDEILTLVKDVYSRAVEKEIYDERVMDNYAYLVLQERNFPYSEKLYTLLTEKDPTNGGYWYNLAISRMYQENYQGAIEPAKMAVENPEENPNYHLDAYTLLADAYSYSKDFEAAEKTLLAAHEKYDYQPLVFQRLGELYLIHPEIRDLEKANAYLDQALTIVCDETVIYNLIKLCVNSDGPQMAIDFCTRNMKLYKDKYAQGVFNYFLAQLYYMNQDTEKAKKTINEAEKIFKKLKNEQWQKNCADFKAELK